MTFEWTPSFIAALATIFVLAALTMPAGIGGGILFVPVLRLIGQMNQSEASAVSQVLITGASAGSILFQILWQRKYRDEPLLAQPYYVVIMMPALLSGSLVGVYLNNILPEIISLVVLVVLCVFSSILIFRKGLGIYRKENMVLETRRPVPDRMPGNGSVSPPPPSMPAQMERGVSLLSLEAGINVQPEVGMYDEIEAPSQSFMYEDTAVLASSTSVASLTSLRRRPKSPPVSQSSETTAAHQPTSFVRGKSVKSESQSWFLRWSSKSVGSFILFVLVYWLILVLFTLLRGSRYNPSFSGVTPCGVGYWILTGAQALLGISLACAIAFGEMKIILKNFFTGVVSTVSGASGGILLNPMLLSRGLDPQQTSATSTIIMFVMASCSALEFLMGGKVEPILASTMALTFVGSVIGMTVVTWIIRKLGRQSILVFLLAGLVVVGGAMLIYLGAVDIVSDANSNINPFELGQLC